MSSDRGSRWGPGSQATAVTLALAAAVWLAWLVVVAPGAGSGTGAAPGEVADRDGAQGAERAAAAQTEEPAPTTYDVFLTRDPFEPVVPEGDGEQPADETDGTTDEPPPGDDTTGDGDDTTDDGDHAHDAGPDDPCTGEEEVVCDGRVVTLVEITTDDEGDRTATIRVDTTDYEVREGEVFAENFRVLSIEPSCVTLLFGDDSFTMCRDDRVLK